MIRGRIAAAAGVLLAAFFLAGTGPYTTRLFPQDLRRIKTVAVIPALGSTFLFLDVRNKPLEWTGPADSHFLEISDWALDPLIAREATKALAKRFAVKPIAFVAADFSSWNDWLLKRTSLLLNGDPAIDAYVFILRDWRRDEIGGSVHDVGGLGFYRRAENAKQSKLGVFAAYRVVVVDALTGDIVAARPALLVNSTLPWVAADPSLWPKSQNDLSEAQRATLIGLETKLIERTLRRTLEELNLAR